MAEEILTHYRKSVTGLNLVPSSGGAFEVSVDGKLVFSKLREGRFPEFSELKKLIDGA